MADPLPSQEYTNALPGRPWSPWAVVAGLSSVGALLLCVLSSAFDSNWAVASGWVLGLAMCTAGVVGIVQTSRTNRAGRPAAIVGVLVGALLLAMLAVLPTFGRARESVQRIKCLSNLRDIAQAMQQYASDHGGAFPADFETLIAHAGLNGHVLLCPSRDHPDGEPATPPFELGENCDYIYLGSGLTTDAPADRVLVIEPVLHPKKDGQLPAAHVMYADGTVELLDEPAARRLLAAPLAPKP